MALRLGDWFAAVRGYAALFALAWLVAMWPMLYNGFPIVYDDTGVYLGSPEHLYPPFPHFYTAFVFLLRSAGSLYAVVAVQALIAVYTLVVAITKLSDRRVSPTTVAAIVLLLAVTQLPWLGSTIMPDFLLGIGLVALLTLALKFHDLTVVDRVLLFAIATGAAVCASANALVMIPFAILLMLTARLLDGRIDSAKALVLAAFAALTIALPLAANTIVFHRTTYAIGSSARLFSKFVDKRIAVPFLERKCGHSRYAACDFLPRIRQVKGGEDFLWTGLADETGAWFDRSGDFALLNMRIIADRPGTVASAAGEDVVTLFGRPTLFANEGREIISHRDPADPAHVAIAETEPHSLTTFLAARQQKDMLGKAPLRRAYTWATLLSLALTIATFVIAARNRDRQILAVALLLVAAIVISTVVHGALSSPVARYMVKVSWLLWLVPIVATLRRSKAGLSVKFV
jgi:hypothetical protein